MRILILKPIYRFILEPSSLHPLGLGTVIGKEQAFFNCILTVYLYLVDVIKRTQVPTFCFQDNGKRKKSSEKQRKNGHYLGGL